MVTKKEQKLKKPTRPAKPHKPKKHIELTRASVGYYASNKVMTDFLKRLPKTGDVNLIKYGLTAVLGANRRTIYIGIEDPSYITNMESYKLKLEVYRKKMLAYTRAVKEFEYERAARDIEKAEKALQEAKQALMEN